MGCARRCELPASYARSKAEWDAQHESNAGKAIVVDFTATWCGPCRMIGPYFEELSTQFENVIFLKVRKPAVGGWGARCSNWALQGCWPPTRRGRRRRRCTFG